MSEQLIVCLPDTQIPYEDTSLMKTFVRFIAAVKPSKVVHVGDLMDQPEPSRWNKGAAGEYAPTLAASFERTRNYLREIRSVFGGPFHIKEGNHDRRVAEYVARYAPALLSLPELKMENLLGLADLEISYERRIFDVAPGWVCAHGDEGGLSSKAGETALKLAQSVGKSVVCGHTHRACLLPSTAGYNGRHSTLWGLEVGNAMAYGPGTGYLRKGAAAWQQGFGTLRVNGRKVTPFVHYVDNGSFIYEGELWGRGGK